MAAPSYEVRTTDVDDIYIVGARRELDDAAVASLAASIAEIGLQTPIRLRNAEVADRETGELITAYALVAGGHRLEACKRLGMRYVPAIIQDMSELDAELWEISENLHRADLTKEQRDVQIRRFAELLVRKEETARTDCPTSLLPDGRRKGQQHEKGIASKIAEQTGLSQRTVRRALIPSESKPSKQADAPISDEDAVEKQIAALMSAWNKASPEARTEFLARVETPVMDRAA